MKNTVVVAGVAAAFLVLAPGAALATTSSTSTTPTSTTPTSTTPTSTTPSGDPDGPQTRITRQLTVSPAKAAPGVRVKLDFACQTHDLTEEIGVRSAALAFRKPGDWSAATVKDVKPGKYAVKLTCGLEVSTTSFEVLPSKQQVAKVPSGAPQTGGTDGPADDSGAAAAAMGVLAIGGGGLVLARRAWRR